MIDEIESILRHSGISAGLPDEIRDRMCRSVAIDIWCYLEEYREAEERAKPLTDEEREIVDREYEAGKARLRQGGI